MGYDLVLILTTDVVVILDLLLLHPVPSTETCYELQTIDTLRAILYPTHAARYVVIDTLVPEIP